MKKLLFIVIGIGIHCKSFSQCDITKKKDEFTGVESKQTEEFRIGKLGYVTRLYVLNIDSSYTLYVRFGDMVNCSVRENDKIIFKSGSDIVSIPSSKYFASKMEFLPGSSMATYSNLVYYKLDKKTLDFLLNKNVDKIRIEYNSGKKDLELRPKDGQIITDQIKCITKSNQ